MEALLQDLKYAFRLMITRPGFTIAAVLSLALGIGANTTIFTLAKAAFLQTVPVKDPATLMMVYSTQNNPRGPEFQFLQLSHLNALDLREKNDVFSGLAIFDPTGLTMGVAGKESQVFAELVNWDFFNLIGVEPALGRNFSPEEDSRSGAGPVAILNYAFWNKQFGGDRKILGQTIKLNQQDITVVGVAPREFHDAGGLFNPDLWVPLSMGDQLLVGIQKEWFHERGPRSVSVVGRGRTRGVCTTHSTTPLARRA